MARARLRGPAFVPRRRDAHSLGRATFLEAGTTPCQRRIRRLSAQRQGLASAVPRRGRHRLGRKGPDAGRLPSLEAAESWRALGGIRRIALAHARSEPQWFADAK